MHFIIVKASTPPQKHIKTIWFQFLFKLVYQQIVYIQIYVHTVCIYIHTKKTLLKIPECLFHKSSGHNLKE